MIAHGLPVVSAFGARARLNPLLDALFDDVRPIGWRAGDRVDRIEDVLKDRLAVTEIRARPAIELPENAGLADGEEHF